MSNQSRDTSEAERRWLSALASGDQDALSGLYELFGEKIFRYAYNMLRNRSDAEDVTAETFLRVLKRSGELRADGAFKTWLYRIAHNLCIDKMRQHKLMELPPDIQVTGTEHRSSIKVMVHQALEQLPIEYREPLILCDLEDVTAKEAAAMLDLTVPALKSRLYRGRRALRNKLGGSMRDMVK